MPCSPPSTESYLRIDRILDAARRHGAEAIHPGYGFLSENADFAAACEDGGHRLHRPLGRFDPRAWARRPRRGRRPSPRACPWCPAPTGAVGRSRKRARFARDVRLSGAAESRGGRRRQGHAPRRRRGETGGRFPRRLERSRARLRNPELYVEKLIERPRHIEIQIMGDRHGNMIHLGERECSDPAPAPEGDRRVPVAAGGGASGDARARWARPRSAWRARRATTTPARSSSWWTQDRNFYFLEMNTRLQVEHPVTELVTGLDLVRLQLRVAAGEPPAARPGAGRVARRGHRVPHLRRGSRTTTSSPRPARSRG